MLGKGGKVSRVYAELVCKFGDSLSNQLEFYLLVIWFAPKWLNRLEDLLFIDIVKETIRSKYNEVVVLHFVLRETSDRGIIPLRSDLVGEVEAFLLFFRPEDNLVLILTLIFDPAQNRVARISHKRGVYQRMLVVNGG